MKFLKLSALKHSLGVELLNNGRPGETGLLVQYKEALINVFLYTENQESDERIKVDIYDRFYAAGEMPVSYSGVEYKHTHYKSLLEDIIKQNILSVLPAKRGENYGIKIVLVNADNDILIHFLYVLSAQLVLYLSGVPLNSYPCPLYAYYNGSSFKTEILLKDFFNQKHQTACLLNGEDINNIYCVGSAENHLSFLTAFFNYINSIKEDFKLLSGFIEEFNIMKLNTAEDTPEVKADVKKFDVSLSEIAEKLSLITEVSALNDYISENLSAVDENNLDIIYNLCHRLIREKAETIAEKSSSSFPNFFKNLKIYGLSEDMFLFSSPLFSQVTVYKEYPRERRAYFSEPQLHYRNNLKIFLNDFYKNHYNLFPDNDTLKSEEEIRKILYFLNKDTVKRIDCFNIINNSSFSLTPLNGIFVIMEILAVAFTGRMYIPAAVNISGENFVYNPHFLHKEALDGEIEAVLSKDGGISYLRLNLKQPLEIKKTRDLIKKYVKISAVKAAGARKYLKLKKMRSFNKIIKKAIIWFFKKEQTGEEHGKISP